MEIVFAGICCFVDSPSGAGKTVILRNAQAGGTYRGTPIPGHTAFIHAKASDVDASNWPISRGSSDDNLLFWLTGQRVSFDPPPIEGGIDIGGLPHVRIDDGRPPICARADEIRLGVLDHPNETKVLALVDVPAGPLVAFQNSNGAWIATLTLPADRVEVIATPFQEASEKRLVITNPEARVVFANVTLGDYLMQQGAPDDSHQFLICELFKPAAAVTADERTETREYQPVPKEVVLPSFAGMSGSPMKDYLSTLSAGCSDSQWP